MNNQTKPKLMRIGDLFRDSWAFWKTNFRTLIKVTLIPLVISIVPMSLFFSFLGFMVSPSIRQIFQGPASTSSPFSLTSGSTVLTILVGAVVYFVFILVVIFFGLVSQRSIFELCKGQYTSYKEMIKLSWRTLHSVIWITVLIRFLVQGASLFLGIPGIIMLILSKFSLFEHFTNTKDNRGLKALVSSWNITRPYFFPVLGRLIAAYLVLGVVSIILVLPIALSIVMVVQSVSTVYTLPFSLLAIVFVALFLVFIIFSGPMMMRYEWLIYRDLGKYSADATASALTEGGVGQVGLDKRYKNRKAICVVLILVGLCYSLISGFVGALIDGGSSKNITIIGRCDVPPASAACENLPTKLKIQRLAEGTNKEFGETIAPPAGRFSIDILDDWEADSKPDKSGDFLITEITKKGDDPDSASTPYITVVSANNDADIFSGKTVEFVNESGEPNITNQKAFLGGAVKGARLTQYVNKNSVYRLDDNVVSIPLIVNSKTNSLGSEGDLVHISWYFFTKNDPYLLNIISPVDKWEQYKAEMYKMALTFRPLPKASN